MWHYLKAEANPDEVPEWQGGRLLVILDEGVLNTENYRATRDYLRTHFYLKAVISLTRDTFVPISKTSTKTSIYYAVKKTDPRAQQREPVFFGHVARTGLDTKGKATHNDFAEMLRSYQSFHQAVRDAYRGDEFSLDAFNWQESTLLGPPANEAAYYFKSGQELVSRAFSIAATDLSHRIHYHFYHPRHHESLTALQARYTTTTLADQRFIVYLRRGEQPTYTEFGDIMVLKTVDLKNSFIAYEDTLRVSQDFFEATPHAQIQKGDILIASTGHGSMGKVDVYDRDEPALADGHLTILRVSAEYDPYFVAYFLRSEVGQLQIEKWFTGSSGQIEFQPEDLRQFLIPTPDATGVPLSEQQRIAAQITKQLDWARTLEAAAERRWAQARAAFQENLFQSED